MNLGKQDNKNRRLHLHITNVTEKAFDSPSFFRLWIAQVISATGDWLGLLAISILAIRVGSGNEGAALSLVLGARIAPGFFFGPLAGVFVDRWNRKRVMVFCDIGRAMVMIVLPFINNLIGLFIASLILEALTMLWSPAKEASVPNLVSEKFLTSANSLSLVAAYGTFPLGAGLMALFGRLSTALFDSSWADNIRLDDMGLAFYANAVSFLITALIISTLALPENPHIKKSDSRGIKKYLADPINDLKQGWQFAFINPVVRTVNAGLATAMLGAGMVIPLGVIYTDELLGAGKSGFGVLLTSLGFGVGAGVLLVFFFRNTIDKAKTFTRVLFGAGISLFATVSTGQIHFAMVMLFVGGICLGVIYVVGFTLLHENVEDHMRGRIFATFYLLVRACVLLALVIGPLVEDGLDRLSSLLWDRNIEIAGLEIAVPGVRISLWLAALIVFSAGVLSKVSLRVGETRRFSETTEEKNL
jgi:dTMP kinase|tara:strand:+ start:3067 stop:4485 length:1419 start_codon:yes stop_codon:yes gene_type:complete